MANNPYVNKVQTADGTSLIDLTDATATASTILSGYTAYIATGQKVTGTASGGSGGEPTSITFIFEQDSNGYILLTDTDTILTASGVSF